MRAFGPALLLVLPVLPAVAAGPGEEGPAGADAYLLRAVSQAMTAPCSAELSPDRAVITGGITATSLRPSEARAQIEKQLAQIGKYVSEKGGLLRSLERVRAVRGLARDPARPDRDPLPFVMVQRLEVEMPAEADVDAVLEGLLQLGLDQFGRELRLDPGDDPRSGYRDTSAKAVVRYRFSRLAEALDDVRNQCRAAAQARWCETNAPSPERKVCVDALARLAPHFATQAMILRSQPVARADGGLAPVQLSYPWASDPEPIGRHGLPGWRAPTEEVELLGHVPLRLQGSITVVLVGAR